MAVIIGVSEVAVGKLFHNSVTVLRNSEESIRRRFLPVVMKLVGGLSYLEKRGSQKKGQHLQSFTGER